MVSCKIGRALGGARATRSEWTAALCGALTLVLWPWAAQGGHLSEYSYQVLRDGEPIGTHRVTISPEGGDIKVTTETDLEVGLGPLTLYEMEHQRRETWRDGVLEEMTAYTNKNGDVYEIAITRDPEGYTRVINGRTDRFEASVRLLALWHEDLFKHTSFLSPMDDETYEISVDFIGIDKIDLINRSVDAFAYRMSGDTNRQLWYDADGHIMKVRLLDHSSTIEYVLDAMNGEPPKLADSDQMEPDPNAPVANLAVRR